MHAVKRKISIFYKPKDKERANYICKQEKEGCPFRVYATLDKKSGQIEIRKINFEHLCVGASSSDSRSSANTQSWILRIVPELKYIYIRTTPNDIIGTVLKHKQVRINCKVAQQCRSALLRDCLEYHRTQFRYLPKYLAAVKDINPTVYSHLEISPRSRIFPPYIYFTCQSTNNI